MKLLAIDPGKTTGYCKAELTNIDHSTNIKLKLEPFQAFDDVDETWDRLVEWEPRYIICEDFEYRNRSRAGLVLFSVELIGIVRLYELKCQKRQVAVYLQKAAQGKQYYTDARLKDLGVYKRGIPHAMDATRHLLHWLTFGAGYQYIQGFDLKDLLV